MSPARRTKQQMADEAWERTQQCDLEEQIATEGGVSRGPEPLSVATVPRDCPHCERVLTLQHGWTISRIDDRLLCNYCGGAVIVPEGEVAILRRKHLDLRAELDARNAKLPPKRVKKTRGAG